MNARLIILLVNVLSTFVLIGLIWTVQLVHYPSFLYVDESRFIDFERLHQFRISLVVVPAMLIELLTTLLLLRWRPEAVPLWIAVAGAALVAVLWISTFAIQTPLHMQLAQGFDAESVRRLITTNWLRTVAWSARGVMLAAALVSCLRAPSLT